MSRATLVVEAAPEYGPGVRRLTLDCRYATTTAHVVGPGETPAAVDRQMVQVLLLKHHAEEGCACTRELRRRYGLTRTW